MPNANRTAERATARLEAMHVRGRDALHEVDSVPASPAYGAHVGDVEERSALPRPLRGVDDAQRMGAALLGVLHRHARHACFHEKNHDIDEQKIRQELKQLCGHA